jgi:hypothetical protein
MLAELERLLKKRHEPGASPGLVDFDESEP